MIEIRKEIIHAMIDYAAGKWHPVKWTAENCFRAGISDKFIFNELINGVDSTFNLRQYRRIHMVTNAIAINIFECYYYPKFSWGDKGELRLLKEELEAGRGR